MLHWSILESHYIFPTQAGLCISYRVFQLSDGICVIFDVLVNTLASMPYQLHRQVLFRFLPFDFGRSYRCFLSVVAHVDAAEWEKDGVNHTPRPKHEEVQP